MQACTYNMYRTAKDSNIILSSIKISQIKYLYGVFNIHICTVVRIPRI